MSDVVWLRHALLASLALGGCASKVRYPGAPIGLERIAEDRSGAEQPLQPGQCASLRPVPARLVDAPGDGRFWVCRPIVGRKGPCASADELDTVALLREVLGPGDPLCSTFGGDVCGPVFLDGSCCYAMDLGEICEGRPLVVGGACRLAGLVQREDWT